jgi:hypothetical protein
MTLNKSIPRLVGHPV